MRVLWFFFKYPAMPLPPITPLFLIFAKCRSNLPHLFLFRIFHEFHPHFEGPDLLLAEHVHPDGQGDKGAQVDVRRLVDGKPERGIVCVAG